MEKSSLLHALAVYPQERTPVSIEKEAGWAPEPVWIFWKTENILPQGPLVSEMSDLVEEFFYGRNLNARKYLDYSNLVKVWGREITFSSL